MTLKQKITPVETMHFIEQFKTLSNQETPAERRLRILPGIIYGLIIASAYTLGGGIVNQLSVRDLPVGVDWRYLFQTWLFLVIWLGLGGGFINWFTQTEESMVAGLLVMTATALGAGALALEGDIPAQFGKIILLDLPIIAISLLMTITLRWLGVHHAEALEKEKTLKTRNIRKLVAITLVIGGIAGLGMNRWTEPTLRGVRDIHSRLQTIAIDTSQAEALFPLADLPQLESHLGAHYTLYGHPSGQSIVAHEVSINFEDGYQITSILLVFPDSPPFLGACAEGDKVILPANQ